jgi:hypothetical protein
MTYQESLSILKAHIKTEQILCHSIEVGAVMGALARKLNKDEEKWRTTGFLHDLDYELEKENPENHGKKTVELLNGKITDQEILNAILAHNEKHTGVARKTDLDFALAASDNIAGLVHATTLVYPDNKITSVKPSSVIKKFKTPSFAAGCNRYLISDIEKIGLSLQDFAEVAIEGMKNVATEIGL